MVNFILLFISLALFVFSFFLVAEVTLKAVIDVVELFLVGIALFLCFDPAVIKHDLVRTAGVFADTRERKIVRISNGETLEAYGAQSKAISIVHAIRKAGPELFHINAAQAEFGLHTNRVAHLDKRRRLYSEFLPGLKRITCHSIQDRKS